MQNGIWVCTVLTWQNLAVVSISVFLENQSIFSQVYDYRRAASWANISWSSRCLQKQNKPAIYRQTYGDPTNTMECHILRKGK